MVAISILTALMGLGTAVDADNARTYLAVTLPAALNVLDQHEHDLGDGNPVKRVNFGLAAARPAFGHAGHVYFATDTSVLSADTGSTWTDLTTVAAASAAIAAAIAANVPTVTALIAAMIAAIPPAATPPAATPPNQLVNGSFDWWQRGAGAFTASLAYSADRWQLVRAGTDTLSVSREASLIDAANGGQFSAGCTFGLGTGAGATTVKQRLVVNGNDIVGLRGRTVSLTIRVRTSTANAVKAGIFSDGSGAALTQSSFHTGSGLETLSVTYGVPVDATYLEVQTNFIASCTAYLDNAMLVVGSTPTAYMPIHPADELARCLRYYEIGFNELQGYMNAAGSMIVAQQYKVSKAASPTVTKVGTWSVSNCAQPTLALRADGFLQGCNFAAAFTAGGQGGTFIGAAGQYLTVEANP